MRILGKDLEVNIKVTDIYSRLAQKRLDAIKTLVRYVRTLNMEKNALEAQILALRRNEKELRRKNDLLIATSLELKERIESDVDIDKLTEEFTQENLYEVIKQSPHISKTELCNLFDITYPTLQNRLVVLEEQGLVKYEDRKFTIL